MTRDKQEWLEFIDSQISIEDQRKKRHGVTIWILVGAVTVMSEKLLTVLFEIPNDAENILLVRAFTTLFFIFVVIFAMFLFMINQNNSYQFVVRSAETEKKFLAIIFKMMITSPLLISLFVNLSRIYPMKPNLILYILLLFAEYLTIHLISMRGIPLEPSYFFRGKTLLDRYVVFMHKQKNVIAIINLIIWNVIGYISLLKCIEFTYSYEIIFASLLINIIILLLILLVYFGVTLYDLSFYEKLKTKAFLDDLTASEIKDLLEFHICGTNTLNWIQNELKDILKKIERYEGNDNSLNSEQKKGLINELETHISNLTEYCNCNRSTSVMENKYIRNKIKRMRATIKSLKQDGDK